MSVHCSSCQFANGDRCARLAMFIVPQPTRRSCRNGKWRLPEEGEDCPKCEGGGWECYGLGHGDPHFRECDLCGNPDDAPCP